MKLTKKIDAKMALVRLPLQNKKEIAENILLRRKLDPIETDLAVAVVIVVVAMVAVVVVVAVGLFISLLDSNSNGKVASCSCSLDIVL